MTGNEKLWRFVGLNSFLDLLSTKELHLTRLDKLTDDPHEGRLSQKDRELWISHYIQEMIEITANSDDPKDSTALRPLVEDLARKDIIGPRRSSFVSCWHASEYDSFAMWRLYCPSNQGVAIETTVDRLRGVLPETIGLSHAIREVDYLDFEMVSIIETGRDVAFCKRQPYEFEREVRLCAFQPFDVSRSSDESLALHPPFVRAKVNLNDLIVRVWLPPRSETWQRDAIKATLRAFGVDVEVSVSSLLDVPT